jgi:hypothetical protein
MRQPLNAQQPPSLIWRRRLLALGAFAGAVAAVVLVVASTLGGGGAGGVGGSGAGAGGVGTISLGSLRGHPVRVVAAGRLAQPVAAAAGAAGGTAGSMLVLGGVDPAGAPARSVQRLDGAAGSLVGRLPAGLAGAAAVEVTNTVYVFGGDSSPAGTVGGAAQLNRAILAIPAVGGGAIREVARLPRALRDGAAAAVAGTAFVVGGYDGTAALDGVVAWRPGGPAHQTGHLPGPLRYAAAAGVGDVVIIVGGVAGGGPTREILRFDPTTHRTARIGQLPAALAHAGAAALGGLVFVIGGRGGGPASATRAVYAIDPASGSVRFAGALPAGLSDAAVATVGDRILIAGGTDRAGRTLDGVLALSLS